MGTAARALVGGYNFDSVVSGVESALSYVAGKEPA
jgi:hypothetical protein